MKNFDENIWEKQRLNIMVDGLMLKFASNPLRDFLLSTENSTIIECSPTDKIWGVGLKVGQLEVFQKEKWKGLNLLGEALMIVRDQLRKK